MLELELGLTIDHASEVLEEYVNTLTEKILVDAFNNLAKNLFLEEKKRQEQWKELLDIFGLGEEDIQERLKRHIDEAIDKVIGGKQSTTQPEPDEVFDYDDEFWTAMLRLVERN